MKRIVILVTVFCLTALVASAQGNLPPNLIRMNPQPQTNYDTHSTQLPPNLNRMPMQPPNSSPIMPPRPSGNQNLPPNLTIGSPQGPQAGIAPGLIRQIQSPNNQGGGIMIGNPDGHRVVIRHDAEHIHPADVYGPNNERIMNPHIKKDDVRAAGKAGSALGAADMVTSGHFQQINEMARHNAEAQRLREEQERCRQLARPGAPVICPNNSEQIRYHQNQVQRYNNQAQFRP